MPQKKSELALLTEALEAQSRRLEDFTNNQIRERLVPEAITEVAAHTVESYTANIVAQARHSIADHITNAYSQASGSFSDRATQEITQRGGQLEMQLRDKFDEMAHRLPPPPPLPEPTEWEISRDNDGRISSIDNGKVRRVPVRDFSGAIVRVVEEPV